MSEDRLGNRLLSLSPCSEADTASLHALWIDPRVRRFLWDDRIISADTAREFVETSLESWRTRGFGLWCVLVPGRAELAGFAGLRELADESAPELLYGIAPELWGRGYATEASRVVLSHGIRSLGLERVIASVDEPNAASIRVLEKLGMARTHEKLVAGRPILYYAISREEFGP